MRSTLHRHASLLDIRIMDLHCHLLSKQRNCCQSTARPWWQQLTGDVTRGQNQTKDCFVFMSSNVVVFCLWEAIMEKRRSIVLSEENRSIISVTQRYFPSCFTSASSPLRHIQLINSHIVCDLMIPRGECDCRWWCHGPDSPRIEKKAFCVIISDWPERFTHQS